MSGTLTSKALRGGALSLSAKIANLVIGVAALAILARRFTPAEYGQAAIVMLITTICTSLPGAMGQALVREGSNERAVLASYTWIFIAALSVTMMGIFAAEAPLLLFFDKSLSPAAYDWLFLVVPIAALSTFLDARLSHAHRFETLAVGDIALQIIGSFLATLLLSFYVAGTSALIGGTAVGYVLKVSIQTWTLRAIPTLQPVAPLSGRLTSLAQLMAVHGANYFGVNGDNIVVAKLLGPTELGIYGRAYNLMSKPVMALSAFVTSVYFPLMVSARDNAASFRSGYLKALAFAAMVGFPLSVYLALLSRDIITVLLGQAWQAVAVPFAILASASYFRLSYRVTETVNLARNSLGNSIGRQVLYAVLVVGGAIGGSHSGVIGVAAAVTAALAIFFMVSLMKANRTADCDLASCFKVSTPAALGTTIACITTLCAWMLLRPQTAATALVESATFWIAYGVYWLLAYKLYPANTSVQLLYLAMTRSRRPLAAQS